MEIGIYKNDAFRVLQDITRGHVNDLSPHIVRRLKDERLIHGEMEDCGLSIHNVAELNGMTVKDISDLLFPSVPHRDEIPELLKVLFLFAMGSDRPCPECGCELERETDGHGDHFWTETKCSNTECDFRDTTEPDWDTQPGGHSFDN